MLCYVRQMMRPTTNLNHTIITVELKQFCEDPRTHVGKGYKNIVSLLNQVTKLMTNIDQEHHLS